MKESDSEDDPTALMSEVSLESAIFHDAEGTEPRGNRRPVYANASLPKIRPSSGAGDNYNVISVSMTNYLQPLDWKMSRDHRPLFSSELEKESVQRSADQLAVRHSAFWVHPVRYEPAVDEPNICRTVQIDHIPKNAEVKDVLSVLCWGGLESIQLVDIGNIRGPQGAITAPFKFARIVFFKARQACHFQRYAHNKPLMMFGQQVRVYVQMEPTYPRSEEVDEAIFVKGMTRILSVFGLTDCGRDRLPEFLEQRGLDLVALELRPHDNEGNENDHYESKTVMEFRSILHAFRALQAMENGGYERAIGFMVEPDYCARMA